MTPNLIPFDLAKYRPGETKVVCRDGVVPRILATDLPGDSPIVIYHGNGLYRLYPNGRFLRNSDESVDLFIVSEPKYVPYDFESVPVGAVVRAETGERCMVNGVYVDSVLISGLGWYRYARALECFTHDDGTPFGRLAE